MFEGLSLSGMEKMTPKDFLIHLYKAGYRIVRNVAREATITASGWDTPPSNLEKAIDGDPTTVTGTGSTTTEGAGVYGYITLDMKKNRFLIMVITTDIWSDDGNTYLYLGARHDGATGYDYSLKIVGETAGTEGEKVVLIAAVYARYIRLQFYVDTATTAYGYIREILALEVIP